MTLVIISLLVIASYTAAVCIKQKGIPYSISATFYKLKHSYWFMAAMWSTAGLLMPAVLDISKPGTEFLAFLACAGMIFVGAAPNFKEEMEGKVHMSGAVICVVASQLWVGCTSIWWVLIPVWIGFPGISYMDCLTILIFSVGIYISFRASLCSGVRLGHWLRLI